MNGDNFQNVLKRNEPKPDQREQQREIDASMTTIIMARLPVRAGHVDIGPDQHQWPEHEAEDQSRPTPDGDRLRPGMAALAGDAAGHHPERYEDRDTGDDEDEQHDPGKNVDERHGLLNIWLSRQKPGLAERVAG